MSNKNNNSYFPNNNNMFSNNKFNSMSAKMAYENNFPNNQQQQENLLYNNNNNKSNNLQIMEGVGGILKNPDIKNHTQLQSQSNIIIPQQNYNIFNNNKQKSVTFSDDNINNNDSSIIDINSESLNNNNTKTNNSLQYINNNIKFSEFRYNLEYYIKSFAMNNDNLQLIYLIYNESDFKDIFKLSKHFSKLYTNKDLDLLCYNNFYNNIDYNKNYILTLPINTDNIYNNDSNINYIEWVKITTDILIKENKKKLNNFTSADNIKNKKLIFICFEKKSYSSYLAGIKMEIQSSISKSLTNYLKPGIIIDASNNIINDLYTTYFNDIIIMKKDNTKYNTLNKYIEEMNDINNNSYSYVNRIIDTIFSDEENPINVYYKLNYSENELETIIKYMKDSKTIPKYNSTKNKFSELTMAKFCVVNCIIVNF